MPPGLKKRADQHSALGRTPQEVTTIRTAAIFRTIGTDGPTPTEIADAVAFDTNSLR